MDIICWIDIDVYKRQDIYRNKKQFSESVKECKAYKIIDAEIRVNWKCNANCVMCGLHNYIYDSETERRDELSFNEITKVLDGIYNLGCKAVTLLSLIHI